MIRRSKTLLGFVVGMGLTIMPACSVYAQCEIQQVYDLARLHVVGKTGEERTKAVREITAQCGTAVKDSKCTVKKIIKRAVEGMPKPNVVAKCKRE